MSILDINTDELRQVVSIANQTNTSITEALNSLNKVVIHNDWKCKERDRINKYTINNRAKVQTIQNNSSSFYRAIVQSSQLFDEVEQELVRETNAIDDLIGQIATIVPGNYTVASAGSAVAGAVPFQSIKEALEE